MRRAAPKPRRSARRALRTSTERPRTRAATAWKAAHAASRAAATQRRNDATPDTRREVAAGFTAGRQGKLARLPDPLQSLLISAQHRNSHFEPIPTVRLSIAAHLYEPILLRYPSRSPATPAITHRAPATTSFAFPSHCAHFRIFSPSHAPLPPHPFRFCPRNLS